MKERDWLPQIIVFGLLVLIFANELNYEDFVSEIAITIIALMDISLAAAMWQPKYDRLRWLIVFYIGTTGLRFLLFGIWIFAKAEGLTNMPEHIIRVISIAPMALSRVLLYMYIKEKP
jgi:hypothetical protein